MSSIENKVSKRQSRRGKVAASVVLSFFIALSPFARAQDISLTTATPTPSSDTAAEENPFAQFATHRPPIALRWKIAVVLAVVVLSSALLWISIRVWRSSNLFDRQYRFPEVATAAERLGANRSGGHLATITFRDRAGPRNEI